MPANPKYLSNKWQRAGKVSAAILGGFIVTTAVHMSIGILLEDKTGLVLTSIWSSWVMWIALMLVAFSFKKAWKVWLLYIGISAVATGIIIVNM